MPYDRHSRLERIAILNGWYSRPETDPELGEPYVVWIECDGAHPDARPDLNKANAFLHGRLLRGTLPGDDGDSEQRPADRADGADDKRCWHGAWSGRPEARCTNRARWPPSRELCETSLEVISPQWLHENVRLCDEHKSEQCELIDPTEDDECQSKD